MKRRHKYPVSVILLFFALMCVHPVPATLAEETSVLKGKVTDVSGKAAEGAMVFLYNTSDVRRAADFISPGTGGNGEYQMTVPPGHYWAVARLKKSGGYGPLMPGDKHSGDPAEIDLDPGSETSTDFVVADLKEAMMMKREKKERLIKISGRIIDEKGSPVSGAYAIASRKEKFSGVPDYLSTWVDKEGRYTLYLPKGNYYIGCAGAFPPGQDFHFMGGQVNADADKTGVDIVWRSGAGR
ncbi:MAG: carboxypeptidase-like regulatory domain-containing protein [Nitrospiraceae bacterium]|nr:carboxypeptidase-like regulatory domain-containing protein [Nitrospiraceae bacterium]